MLPMAWPARSRNCRAPARRFPACPSPPDLAHLFDPYQAETRLKKHFGVATLRGSASRRMDASLCAAAVILDYLAETQRRLARPHRQTLAPPARRLRLHRPGHVAKPGDRADASQRIIRRLAAVRHRSHLQPDGVALPAPLAREPAAGCDPHRRTPGRGGYAAVRPSAARGAARAAPHAGGHRTHHRAIWAWAGPRRATWWRWGIRSKVEKESPAFSPIDADAECGMRNAAENKHLRRALLHSEFRIPLSALILSALRPDARPARAGAISGSIIAARRAGGDQRRRDHRRGHRCRTRPASLHRRRRPAVARRLPGPRDPAHGHSARSRSATTRSSATTSRSRTRMAIACRRITSASRRSRTPSATSPTSSSSMRREVLTARERAIQREMDLFEGIRRRTARPISPPCRRSPPPPPRST